MRDTMMLLLTQIAQESRGVLRFREVMGIKDIREQAPAATIGLRQGSSIWEN
jgi:hypothetical protein